MTVKFPKLVVILIYNTTTWKQLNTDVINEDAYNSAQLEQNQAAVFKGQIDILLLWLLVNEDQSIDLSYLCWSIVCTYLQASMTERPKGKTKPHW